LYCTIDWISLRHKSPKTYPGDMIGYSVTAHHWTMINKNSTNQFTDTQGSNKLNHYTVWIGRWWLTLPHWLPKGKERPSVNSCVREVAVRESTCTSNCITEVWCHPSSSPPSPSPVPSPFMQSNKEIFWKMRCKPYLEPSTFRASGEHPTHSATVPPYWPS